MIENEGWSENGLVLTSERTFLEEPLSVDLTCIAAPR